MAAAAPATDVTFDMSALARGCSLAATRLPASTSLGHPTMDDVSTEMDHSQPRS